MVNLIFRKTNKGLMPTTTDRVWTGSEIKQMWPQAAGELKGLQSSFESRSMDITANQLGMALQLANIGFKTLDDEAFPVEKLDKMEAVFDYIITRANRQMDVPGIFVIIPIIDRLWTVLKHTREQAGRPTPRLH